MDDKLNLRNTTLSVEDFDQSMINDAVKNVSVKTFISTKILLLTEKPSNDGNSKLALVAYIFFCSIRFYGQLWKQNPNRPYSVQLPNEISVESAFDLKTIVLRDIEFLISIYEKIENKFLKAMICEVILCAKNLPIKLEVAKTAINCYINEPFVFKPYSSLNQEDSINDEQHWDYFERLGRAHSIARLFELKEETKLIENKIIKIFDVYCLLNEDINFNSLLDAMAKFKHLPINYTDTASKLENYVHLLYNKRLNIPQYNFNDLIRSLTLSGAALNHAARFYLKDKNYEKWYQMIIAWADAPLRPAIEAMENNDLEGELLLIDNSTNRYRKILDQLSSINGEVYRNSIRSEILRRIGGLEGSKSEPYEFYRIATRRWREFEIKYNEELTKSLIDFKSSFKNRTLLSKIVSLCFCLPEFDLNWLHLSATKLFEADHVFQITKASNRNTDHHSATNENEPQNVDYHKCIIYNQYIMLTSSNIYNDTICQNNLNHEELKSVFDDLANNSTIVAQNQKNTLILGLSYGFQGKQIESMHLLMPAFESLVRNFLKSNSISVNSKEIGNEDYQSLNKLFEPEVNMVLLNDKALFNHYDELNFFISNKIGVNFRNDIAHGIILDKEYLGKKELFNCFLILITKILLKSVISNENSNEELKSSITNTIETIVKLDPTEFQELTIKLVHDQNIIKRSMYYYGDSPPDPDSLPGLKIDNPPLDVDEL